MQIKTFKIPLGDSGETEDELNKFLRLHRVLKVERAFCLESICLLLSLVVLEIIKTMQTTMDNEIVLSWK